MTAPEILRSQFELHRASASSHTSLKYSYLMLKFGYRMGNVATRTIHLSNKVILGLMIL